MEAENSNDNVPQTEDEDEYIEEDDIPKILQTLSASYIKHMEEEKYDEALKLLKRSEDILEAVTTQGGYADPDFILCTLHNTACCYQNLGDLDNCVKYLDATSYNASTLNTMVSDDKIADRIKRSKYRCKIHIQIWAAFSQMMRHHEAIASAKRALQLAWQTFELTEFGYRKMSKKLRSKGSKDTLAHQQLSLAERAAPTLRQILDFLQSGTLPKNDQMRSILGIKSYNEWVYNYAITDIMFIQPLTIEEIKIGSGVCAELTKDYMTYKISLLAVTYFCIATEMRFIKSKQVYNEADQDNKDAEMVHDKAVKLIKAYFPTESPLTNHIVTSYHKRFLTDLQEIPEEETLPKRSVSTSKSTKIAGMARIDSARNNRAVTPNMNFRKPAAPDSARRSNRRSKSDLRFSNRNHNKSDPYLRGKKATNDNFPIKQNKAGLRRLKTPTPPPKEQKVERARSAKRKRSPGGHFIV